MTWLELAGASAIYLAAMMALCVLAAWIGSFFGRDMELGGLVYVLVPPVVILVFGTVVGLVLLGRQLA